MENTLSDLFFGKIIPYEEFAPKTKEYQETCEKYNRACDTLEEILNQSDPALALQFKEVMDRYSAIARMEHAAAFASGFRLGIKLMMETL